MSLEQQFALSLNILLSALLSALIGIDREQRKSAGGAGLRTHMLVGIASCLFTVISIHGFGEGDPSRVAAQVVSGIGFLGAGVIILRGRRVHNLTTAASVWATAAIGMTVGAGSWLLAINTTIIAWFVLDPLRRLSKSSNRAADIDDERTKNID